MKRLFTKKIQYKLEYYLVIGLLFFMKLIPISLSSYIFSRIFYFLGRFSKANKVLKNNLKLIYKDKLTYHKLKNIEKGVWYNLGANFAEFPFINKFTEQQKQERIKIFGLENISEYRKNKVPFLVVGGHFGNWELMTYIGANFLHHTVIFYRAAKNPYINQLIKKIRALDNITFVASNKENRMGILRAIKNKHNLGMLIDQKICEGIKVPFCGEPAFTTDVMAKLALEYQYPIVPIRVLREEHARFNIRIYPPIPISEHDTIESLTIKANKVLEEWVYENPEQWFWVHNRWKPGY